MGEATSQIEAHIENTRADLGSNLQELEQKVKSVTDWKQHFQKSPMTLLGAAFGGGFAGVEMACRCVEAETVGSLFLDEQEAPVLLDHCGHRDIGLPAFCHVHDSSWDTSASRSTDVGFGSTSVTIQPAPSALSISTEPPWRWTTVRTSSSPSPTP